MNFFKEKYGNWALITGASSGIGEEFAKQLAALKLDLILVARRKEKLIALSRQLIVQHNIEVEIIEIDLSSPNFFKEIEQQTEHLDIGLLINNAGFAITGDFLDDKVEHQIQLLDINCKAPLILSHYFGNKMVIKGKGAIINIASASAFLPMPYWANYAASKAYLLHFTEGLWYELKKKGVDVLAVCPGGTKTEFAQTANIQSHGMSVEKVVSESLKNPGKKPTIVTGFSNKFSTSFLKFFTRKMLIKIGAKVVENMRRPKMGSH
jgi:short-subunit dehydrogenase